MKKKGTLNLTTPQNKSPNFKKYDVRLIFFYTLIKFNQNRYRGLRDFWLERDEKSANNKKTDGNSFLYINRR